MIDVIEVLRKDHEDVRLALRELEADAVAEPGAGNRRLWRRKEMAERLVAEESRHEAIEERYFWPTVRERVPHGDRLAEQAISQEQDARRVLDQLERTEPGYGEFETLLWQLIAASRAHMEFEETRVWPRVERALSERDRCDLGALLERAKKAAPTRPHPGIPPSHGAGRVAGPIAAAADRIRDALAGRSRLLVPG